MSLGIGFWLQAGQGRMKRPKSTAIPGTVRSMMNNLHMQAISTSEKRSQGQNATCKDCHDRRCTVARPWIQRNVSEKSSCTRFKENCERIVLVVHKEVNVSFPYQTAVIRWYLFHLFSWGPFRGDCFAGTTQGPLSMDEALNNGPLPKIATTVASVHLPQVWCRELAACSV